MRSLFLFFVLALSVVGVFGQSTNVIDAGMHHLGRKEMKAWPEANRKAEGEKLEVEFTSRSNPTEWTLRLKQRDVSQEWHVEINGQAVGKLGIKDSEIVTHFSVPRGVLVEGMNKLAVVGTPADDVLVGQIELIDSALKDVLKLGHLTVNIVDAERHEAIPVRITVASAGGKMADLYNVKPAEAVMRKGIIYCASQVEFDLPEGDWILTAMHGQEWSRVQLPLRVFIGRANVVTAPIRREVDTTGFIAADTHSHTFTHSGHGDASVEERLVTLAGEGVEMPIATDHDYFVDYSVLPEAGKFARFFKPVVGDEVTTGNGHFNAFPFEPTVKPPSNKETNWVKLVEGIREKGAQFVILNHPRWPAITNSAMAKWGLNRATGIRTNAMAFTFDAMEVVNAVSTQKDPDYVLRDWFAVLNHGERIWAVGGSDSHTIADPIGQSRTYIASATDDPAAIDVRAVIESMKAGNMSVSYGIFGEARVSGSVKMGGLARPTNGMVDLKFRMACANWVPAKKAVVFMNGRKVAEKELTMRVGGLLDTNISFQLPAPAHDAFVVCVAYGGGIKDVSWKTGHDYTLAVTNPIFIDADGDGKFSSARETALALLRMTGDDVGKIEKALGDLDPAIGVQMMAEVKARLAGEQIEKWTALLERMALKDDFYLAFRSPNVDPK